MGQNYEYGDGTTLKGFMKILRFQSWHLHWYYFVIWFLITSQYKQAFEGKLAS
jgi:hypothetical protein